jgi:hypothetical protein
VVASHTIRVSVFGLARDFLNAGDGLPMWIPVNIIQLSLQHANGGFSKDVLDFLGIVMDVVRPVVSSVGQIPFPETMITNDCLGTSHALRGEINSFFFVSDGSKACSCQFSASLFGFMQGLTS